MGTEEHTAKVEPAFAVIEVELVELAQVIFVTGEETVVEPESFSLRLLGINAHHSLYRSVITCTRIANHLYTLHIVGRKLVQFRGVTHLASVNVDFSRTRTEHVYRAFLCRYPGKLAQQVIARACFL